MRYVNPAKAAISVGSVIGLWHFTWVTFVALGWAKPLLDFILRLHFLEIDYAIAPFALGSAALLIAITFSIGALFGLVFALIWNRLAREAPAPSAARAATAIG